MKDLRNSVGSVSAKLRATHVAKAATPSVRRLTIAESNAGQRLDNYLIRELKGVPRSHVYRVIRDGQVRVNGRRGDATQRLDLGDEVRIPPVRVGIKTPVAAHPVSEAELPVIFEDHALIVVDKPAKMAVHGGSGVSFGVIERLRAARPSAPMLELVHRLDRETSGLLLVAKKRGALTALHAAWGDGSIRKRYLALVKGEMAPGKRVIELPLRKYLTREGERRVSVDRHGQMSATIVEPLRIGAQASLVRAELKTGRTHQIRVHLAHIGHPILGDEKYGDFALNKSLARHSLKRMFLHAAELHLRHPIAGDPLSFRAALPPELERVLLSLLGEGNADPTV
jgi:23S rRNA pseudouridine955/2504/2580 synthase